MAEYEYNGDLWFYKGHEYKRGDVVNIAGDLDDDHQTFIDALVEQGTLVEPGHAEKLRKEQEEAEEEQEKLRLEQVERDDAEAHRRVEAEQRRLHGDPKNDDDSKAAAEESASNEGSSAGASASAKPASRRSAGK
jgi:hypothetical protein